MYKPQLGNYLPILGVFVLLILVGGGAYYFGTQNSRTIPQNKTKTEANPTSAPVVTQSPKIDKTSDWNTYISNKLGFSIKYPKQISKFNETWQYEEISIVGNTNTMVGFGTPSSAQGGYIWGVTVYTDKTVEHLIKEKGMQFEDRKELRSNIIVDGKSASFITVTTNQHPDWISKTVLVEHGGKIFEISNGAVELPEFDTFYNSFKILN